MPRRPTIWNQRMLLVLSLRLEAGDTQGEFCKAIGLEPSNLVPIKKGLRGFTPSQIHAACSKYGISPSWIFGLSFEMKLRPARSVIDQLKAAVKAVEGELKK